MTTHVMIDLETMGTGPTAAIIQIGAIVFNPAELTVWTRRNDEELGFERSVRLDSCLRAGLKADGSTVEWWLKQPDPARAAVITNGVVLAVALRDLRAWLAVRVAGYHGDGRLPAESLTVWSHGAGFDLVILESAFRALDLVVPWDHRAARDTRTLFWLAETLTGWEKPKRETAHTALADAVAQAADVQAAYRRVARNMNLLFAHDAKRKPTINELVARATAAYAAMTHEQREEHDAAQRESFVRGNLAIDRAERDVGITTRIMPTRYRHEKPSALPNIAQIEEAKALYTAAYTSGAAVVDAMAKLIAERDLALIDARKLPAF